MSLPAFDTPVMIRVPDREVLAGTVKLRRPRGGSTYRAPSHAPRTPLSLPRAPLGLPGVRRPRRARAPARARSSLSPDSPRWGTPTLHFNHSGERPAAARSHPRGRHRPRAGEPRVRRRRGHRHRHRHRRRGHEGVRRPRAPRRLPGPRTSTTSPSGRAATSRRSAAVRSVARIDLGHRRTPTR